MNEAETAAGLPKTSNYRYAKQVDNQLFVAGQVPHDSNAQLVGKSDPSVQAAQCLANLRQLLNVYGFSENDIQQLTIYVVSEAENLASAWSAVEQWFGGEVPPATLLGVAQLGYVDQLVEIDATIIREVSE
ncbi:RidA family protein [Acaryochloris sp. IP29b_bin.137]|uniref:RidA family protein n=1 Tax=Acaryochloris sp. IP29b_bin.137 TaxID=2969217 RepID=UPI0026157DFB|nr:RidA family protein [Acaryochloris sp. IP29b_bin.137]